MKTVRFPLSPLLGLALLAAVLQACSDSSAGGTEMARTAGGSTLGAKAAPGEAGGPSAMLAHEMAQQHLQKGEMEKAEAELLRAVELDPKMSEAHFDLGKLLVQKSSQQVWSKARDLDILGQGRAELEKACELEPANDEYRFHLGRAHYLLDNLEGAMLQLNKAIELNPKMPGAWKALGRAQVDSGETAAGRDSYLRALELNPGDASTHFQLGQALEVLEDLPGARAAYAKSVELEPSAYEVHGRLSQVCSKLGDSEGEATARAGMQRWMQFDEQMRRRQKAVNRNPGDAAAVRRVGEMYVQIEDWDKALEWLLRAIHINTRDWRAHWQCGITRRHLKDYVYATHHLKEAEFLAPDVLDPKLELLRLYAERKDDASLVALLGKTEGEAAGDGNSLYFLGEVCREIGREEDSRRLFEKATALGVSEAPTEFATAEDEGAAEDEAEPEDP